MLNRLCETSKYCLTIAFVLMAVSMFQPFGVYRRCIYYSGGTCLGAHTDKIVLEVIALRFETIEYQRTAVSLADYTTCHTDYGAEWMPLAVFHHGPMPTVWRARYHFLWEVPALALVMFYLMYRVRRNCNRILQRFNSGCCVACGYDLRASGDICPECGAPRAHAVAEASDRPPGYAP